MLVFFFCSPPLPDDRIRLGKRRVIVYEPFAAAAAALDSPESAELILLKSKPRDGDFACSEIVC